MLWQPRQGLICGRGAIDAGAGPTGVRFDGTSTGVTLSGSQLTVTGTGGGVSAGARSLSFQTTGKFYFEVVLDSISPSPPDDAIGIAQSTATYAQFIGLSNLTKTAGVYTSAGDIWAGGGFQDNIAGGAWTAGTVACVAVDVGANKFWVRKNSGSWNASFAGDPAAGTGSITIQSASWAPLIGMSAGISDSLTARFLLASWTLTAPTGFGAWT